MSSAVLSARPEPPRVSYAIGRSVGNAVARNRVRRQLRSAVREHRDLLTPGCGYLVRVVRSPAGASYSELSGSLRDALHGHTSGARG